MNGDAQDHLDWELSYLSILSIWLSHCQTAQFTWPITLLLIICKEILKDLNLEFWALDQLILPLISGILSSLENHTQVVKFLIINCNNLESRSCIGILSIFVAQARIWLKITWLWLSLITLLFGKMNLINGLVLSSVMDSSMWRIRKCQSQKEISWHWSMPSNNMELMLQELHALSLETLLTMPILHRKQQTQPFFNYQLWKCSSQKYLKKIKVTDQKMIRIKKLLSSILYLKAK